MICANQSNKKSLFHEVNMMEYMVHWWGGCSDKIKAEFGYEEYMYFNNSEDRERVIQNLNKFKHLGLVIDKKQGQLTHKDTIAKMELIYEGKAYHLEYNFGKEYPKDSAEFMFFEGNYSCDCNLSLFIGRYVEEDFPELDCGEKISINNFEIVYR